VVALHTAIAIILIVLLIIWVKVNPVISLIIGSLYLGLVTGVGFVATLVGLSTKGTLKTLTMVTSIASVVSLPMVMLVALFA
jgi:H+/gluconate symporter-like permease